MEWRVSPPFTAPAFFADKIYLKLLGDVTVKIVFKQAVSHRMFEAFMQASFIIPFHLSVFREVLILTLIHRTFL